MCGHNMGFARAPKLDPEETRLTMPTGTQGEMVPEDLDRLRTMLAGVKGAAEGDAPAAPAPAPASLPGSFTPELQVSSPSAGSDLPAAGPAATHASDAAGPAADPAAVQSPPPAPPPPATGRTAARGGPSAYRGVVWHKSNSKWEARIYEGGKQKFLGYFTNEDAAAAAYDDAAARLHGAAAKLNFPERYRGVELPAAAAAAAPAARAPAAGRTAVPRARARAPAARAAGADAAPSARRGGGGAARVQPVKGSSRFRGVSWNSNCSKWRAQVWKGSEVHHLGYFEREEDAARAYDEAVLRIRGPDAPTNYPKAHYGLPSASDDEGAGAARRRGGAARPRAASAPEEEEVEEGDGYDTSRMLGVSWSEPAQAWVSEIWDGERYRGLGAFGTEAAAARAYDVACLVRHGADALTNFPLGAYETELAAATLAALADDYEGGVELWGPASAAASDSRRSASPAASGAEHTVQEAPEGEAAAANVATAAVIAAAAPRGASRFHGVSWDRRKGRWFSQIQIRGSRKFLGYFDDEEGAAAAYDAAALRLHGAAAALNFPAAAPAPAAPAPAGDDAGVLAATVSRLMELLAAQQRQTLAPPPPLAVAPAPPAAPAPTAPTVAAMLHALLARQQEAAARAAWEEQLAAQQRAAAMAAAVAALQAQAAPAAAPAAGKRSYEELAAATAPLQAALASWVAAKKARAA